MNERRALIRLDDLRRMAQVVREEGVDIRAHLAPDGSFICNITMRGDAVGQGDDDLDDRVVRFGAA
jgi:hypothetical protein